MKMQLYGWVIIPLFPDPTLCFHRPLCSTCSNVPLQSLMPARTLSLFLSAWDIIVRQALSLFSATTYEHIAKAAINRFADQQLCESRSATKEIYASKIVTLQKRLVKSPLDVASAVPSAAGFDGVGVFLAMTTQQLTNECLRRGLPKTHKRKGELISRIIRHDMEEKGLVSSIGNCYS